MPDHRPEPLPDEPRVSVVIPVRNEAATVTAAVRSALEQDYGGNIEVVVADGRSDDGTPAIIAELAQTDRRVRLIDNPGLSAASGLNAAIEAANGNVIVRCDGHAALPRGYVATAVELLEDTGADNVGGIQAARGVAPIERAIAAAMAARFGTGGARYRSNGPAGYVDTVYLGVFRREALDRVGGFDTSLERNQDYELNYRLRDSGGTVYFDPRLAVEYRPRSSIGELWRQYFRYGRGKRRVLQMHPRSVRLRQTAAPALVAGLAASAALLATPARRVGLVVPVAYAAGVVGTAAVESIRRRDPAMAYLAAVLPTMHLSWGLGFLAPGQPARRPA